MHGTIYRYRMHIAFCKRASNDLPKSKLKNMQNNTNWYTIFAAITTSINVSNLKLVGHIQCRVSYVSISFITNRRLSISTKKLFNNNNICKYTYSTKAMRSDAPCLLSTDFVRRLVCCKIIFELCQFHFA